MSLNKTQYLSKKILDHNFGKAAFTMPTTVYLGLFTSDPTEVGLTVGEVSGNNYARVAITSSMAAASSTGQTITNSVDITFPQATPSDWNEVTHAAVFDASTSGNMLYFGPAVTSRVIEAGEIFKILAGQLVVQET